MALTGVAAEAPLVLPVRHVLDSRARLDLREFRSRIWAETVRDFGRCGMQFSVTEATGEVRRLPSGLPRFAGTERRAINVVLTDRIPIEWAKGRGIAGVSTMQDGHPVCLIALDYAHAHKIPLLAVNTCVHELLHVIFGDILEPRPKGLSGQAREFRIDAYATRLWLFHDGAEIRRAAGSYMRLSRSDA